MVLYNACLATGDINRPVLPTADALAINQGHISALGSSIDMLRLAGIATEKIDLGGRLVVPGFIDSHIHFYEWALARRELQLDDLSSLEDLLARVATTAQSLPPASGLLARVGTKPNGTTRSSRAASVSTRWPRNIRYCCGAAISTWRWPIQRRCV